MTVCFVGKIKYEYGIRSFGDGPATPYESIIFQASKNKDLYRFSLSNAQDVDVRKIDTEEFKGLKAKIEKVIENSKTDGEVINFKWSNEKYLLASFIFGIYFIVNFVGMIFWLKYMYYSPINDFNLIYIPIFIALAVVSYLALDYFNIDLNRFKSDAYYFNLIRRIFLSCLLALILTFSINTFYYALNFHTITGQTKIEYRMSSFKFIPGGYQSQPGYHVDLEAIIETDNENFKKWALFLSPDCKTFINVGKKTNVTFFKGKFGIYFTSPESYEQKNCGIRD